MSFSSAVKNELCRRETAADCCLKAELAAAVRYGGINFAGEEVNESAKDIDGSISAADFRGSACFVVTTENAAFARRVFSNVKKIYGISVQVLNRKNQKLKKHPTYTVSIPVTVQTIELRSLFRRPFNIRSGISAISSCCKKSYLRGAFLAAGSVSDPGKAYHLEIVAHTIKQAAEIRMLMAGFGLSARTVARKGGYVTYIKEGGDIADFLNITGAHKSLLEMENIRIVKEMRNNVNRIVNCETANLDKTVRAACRQVENMRYIADVAGMDAIPENLREIAEKRILFPEATLKELGAMLRKPVGKSGASHRLEKIDAIAEKIRAGIDTTGISAAGINTAAINADSINTVTEKCKSLQHNL